MSNARKNYCQKKIIYFYQAVGVSCLPLTNNNKKKNE